MKERIIVKAGSQILTRQDGTLDVTRMSALVDQIAELHKSNVEVILVSSGAVASGKTEIKARAKLDIVLRNTRLKIWPFEKKRLLLNPKI
jgi:glutamate 5-kinase